MALAGGCARLGMPLAGGGRLSTSKVPAAEDVLVVTALLTSWRCAVRWGFPFPTEQRRKVAKLLAYRTHWLPHPVEPAHRGAGTCIAERL